MAKAKKHKLSFLPEADHIILAIASHEKGYHLAWTLNNHLGMHLIRTGDYSITKKKQELVQSFPLFSWTDQTKMLSYHLVANRSESGILVNKLKNIDFFLHISPAPEGPFIDQLLDQLPHLPVIITAFRIDPADYPVLNEMVFE
jgi:hypothetical protein